MASQQRSTINEEAGEKPFCFVPAFQFWLAVQLLLIAGLETVTTWTGLQATATIGGYSTWHTKIYVVH